MKKKDTIICNHKCWDEHFERKCEEHKEGYIIDNSFFTYIEPEIFIKEIQEATLPEIYNFMVGIRRVYSFSNLNEFFKPDIPNIKSILEKIDIVEMSLGKKTRRMALEKLRNRLQEYLELIEKPIYKI